MRDYYYILGISEKATESEIKTAYRKLSLKFHPDKNDGEKYFEERFKEIQEAFETLSDSTKRKSYDFKLNQFKSVRDSSNYAKNFEEELKRKYEAEFRSKEEELKRKYEFSEKKQGKDVKKAKNNLFKISPFSIIFLTYIILIPFVCYKHYQEDFPTERTISTSKILGSKIINNNQETIDIQESMGNEDQSIGDSYIISNESLIGGIDTNATYLELTQEQLEEYYRNGKNDENIQLLRRKIDEYVTGNLMVGNQVDQIALDSFNYYGKEYLESKFYLATIEDGKYGGKWMQIVFINKPDRVFNVWVLHNRVAAFGDALWDDSGIRMVKNDRQMLNSKYGF